MGTDFFNMSYGSASLLVTIVNGTGLPARILAPLIADRLGPLNVILPVSLLTAISAFSLLAVTSSGSLHAFAVYYGLFSGAFQSLMPTAAASISRLDQVGTRLGMTFSFLSFAGLTGPPLGGLLQDEAGYRAAQGWAAGCAILCTIFLVLARGFRTEWRIKMTC